MALIYEAQVAPTKAELLAGWVPTRSWSGGAPVDEVLGSYRFDDADGQVGIETHLVRAGDRTLQVPLTYRSSELPGAEDRLITTMDHSVLGRRWVYDAAGDPVYVRELLTAMLTGGAQATVWVHREDGEPERREPSVHVSGSGDPSTPVPSVGSVSAEDDEFTTVVRTGTLHLALARSLDASDGSPLGDRTTLSGTWPGRDEPTVLAVLLTESYPADPS